MQALLMSSDMSIKIFLYWIDNLEGEKNKYYYNIITIVKPRYCTYVKATVTLIGRTDLPIVLPFMPSTAEAASDVLSYCMKANPANTNINKPWHTVNINSC